MVCLVQGIRANPGGSPDPSDILGRTGLVNEVWRTLDQQSVALTAERRMGKTCVLALCDRNAPPNTFVVYRDLEGIDSPTRFIEATLNDVFSGLGAAKRVRQRLHQGYRLIEGADFGKIRLPELSAPDWRALLDELFRELGAQEQRFVFLWDELPLMVDKILHGSDASEAIDLLDLLRQFRQTHRNLPPSRAGQAAGRRRH